MMTAQLPDRQELTYLQNLNPAQRAAVEATEGPVLVLAGAGTGKTRVLITRLTHLLATGRAWPSQILAVTFTNKAAMEMKRRVSDMRGEAVEGWWLGTFHALAARMLRRHAELVGLNSNYTILDDDDQVRLLKQLVEAEGIDPKKWPPRMLMSFIQRWKDRALLPEQVGVGDAGDMADGKLLRLYTLYQERLRVLNACDFGDLLLHVITIFRDPKNADVLAQYQDRFKYILVDEYQDTNTAQYLWLRLLAQKHKNICCVGDDDQSIYGWRGAEIENILKFEKDFPGAKVIRLEQNYRSTQHILSAANGVIAHNKNRLGKELWSGDAEGEKVTLRGVWDGPQEAQAVADIIGDLQRKGHKLHDAAILVRASHQMGAFEDYLFQKAIAYKIIGGPRFWERLECRDFLAYLRVTAQPDDELAFERIVNVPKRGLGDVTMQIVRTHARRYNIPLFLASCQIIETEELKPKPREVLRKLIQDFERWRKRMQELSHVELAQNILEESGYIAMWQADKSPEAPGRLENLQAAIGQMGKYDNLGAFLEYVALAMDVQEKDGADMVSIMTLHGAKGLEFDTVFLPGWEEGVFPNQRSMDENGLAGLEEERRLAYVGITRARKKAYIFFAANRMIYGSWTSCLPSRFIDELPKDHVDVVVETGLYGGHGGGGQRSYGRSRSAQLVDNSIERVSPSLESTGGFTCGDRVFHQKFGYGTVVTTDGNKLDIKFEKSGRKKVLDSFVEKAVD